MARNGHPEGSGKEEGEVSYDPRKIRPRDGWVIVLADARKLELASGILLSPNESGVEKVTEGAGEVIRVGRGIKCETAGLEPGQRVVYRGYLKYANPIENDEVWPDGRKKTYFIMSMLDILAITPEGMEVGVFSGRPQVPELKQS